ncbi:ATP-binding protein [Kangiella sp.]|uniref:ATP-binding protein n=1 Tax=Kangiella sp. TaxID=1920245 RepID=UPI003A8CEF2A
MELTLPPNYLHPDEQSFKLEKFSALIGENGCGKSSILQTIFEGRMSDAMLSDWKIVCFSSGHNERYSSSFSTFLKKARKSKSGLSLHCFYYDKTWSPLLIFLASSLKKEGKVRELLKSLGHVKESDDLGDDISSKLSCSFRVDRPYVNKVAAALKQEEAGETDTIRSTPFFRSLSSFIEKVIDEEYDFEDIISKQEITISSTDIINTSFESAHVEGETSIIGDDPAVTFLTQAIDSNNPITKTSLRLTFHNDHSLAEVSDGEYQLLFVYALLDLFDNEKTLFLFDEADSHLHYKNINKLWASINNAKGRALMTTHLLDSISEIGVENIHVVNKGRVLPFTERKELQDRLEQLSNIKKAKLKTYALHELIVLMDNENDWEIFTRLVIRKLGQQKKEGITSILRKICCISVESGWDSHTSSFAAKKLKWLESFVSYIDGSNHKAKNVYLICDRDSLPLAGIDNESLQLNGGKELMASIVGKSKINAQILVWRRREMKHYLLSYTALMHHQQLKMINNDSLGLSCYLHENMNGDNQCLVDEGTGIKAPLVTKHIGEDLEFNEGLGQLASRKVKSILDPLINTDKIGLDHTKLQAYIDLIPPDEISEDITNMYNFIIGKL